MRVKGGGTLRTARLLFSRMRLSLFLLMLLRSASMLSLMARAASKAASGSSSSTNDIVIAFSTMFLFA